MLRKMRYRIWGLLSVVAIKRTRVLFVGCSSAVPDWVYELCPDPWQQFGLSFAGVFHLLHASMFSMDQCFLPAPTLFLSCCSGAVVVVTGNSRYSLWGKWPMLIWLRFDLFGD